jgi:predicted nucleotidyltransferase
MENIVKMIFGSHLYGTNTDKSDMDYKGVFMPSWNDILLGKIPKSLSYNTKIGSAKNTPNDTDTELYSLHYFIKLACDGETVALDMLHTPDQFVLEKSPIWTEILLRRDKFYTKNLKAFVGYARRQASKYGIKGSRLNDAKRVLEKVPIGTHHHINGEAKLVSEIWDSLPEGEHIFKLPADEFHNNLRMYEVCGRKVQETARVAYLYDVVKRFYDNYGERARQAANNENIDWKAVSHALRAAYQVKQILTEGTITFPLQEAEFLRKVKEGMLHYKDLSPLLDSLIDEIEQLSKSSPLPEKVNRKYWDDFIIEMIEQFYFGYLIRG